MKTARALHVVHALVAVVTVLGLLAHPAEAKGKKKKKGRGSADPALVGPLQLELAGFDLASGAALLAVRGPSRAPEPRHFLFTDERHRRFLPSQGQCQADGPGAWRCKVQIARIYQRTTLVGISIGLRERTATAPEDQVRSLWAEARARTPLPPPERPRGGDAAEAKAQVPQMPGPATVGAPDSEEAED